MSPQAAAMFVVGRLSANSAPNDFSVVEVALALLMLALVLLFIWISERVG